MNIESTHRQKDTLSLRDILTVFFKYLHLILAISFLITLASLVLAFSKKTVYEAETTLLVKIGREHMFVPAASDNTPRMSIDIQTIVDPELTILASEDLSQSVLETIGAHLIYPDILEDSTENFSPTQLALLRFKENLHVEQEAESNVIRVTFQHEDPAMAARSVNTLAKFWKEKHLKIFSTPQAPFLEEQAESYRRKLELTETQLQQFKHENGISSFSKQKELLLEQRQKLDMTLNEVQKEIQGLAAQISSITKQMKMIPNEVSLSTVNSQRDIIDHTKQELLALQRKEQELAGKYQDKNRLLTDLRKEIVLIQNFIKEQENKIGDTITMGKNPIYQQLELELLGAQSKQGALQKQYGVTTEQFQDLNHQISYLSQLQQKFDKLVRNATKDRENLARYMEKVEAAKITEEMDRQQIANVSVIQAATVPMQPVKSKFYFIIFLGLILGVGVSLALALVLENLQRGYVRPEQITHDLGLPILVSITNKR